MLIKKIEYDIYVAGYLCLDFIPLFKRDESSAAQDVLLLPGRLIEINGLDACPGGVIGNSGLAIKKFGKKAYLNGLVGSDHTGATLIQLFKQYGLEKGIKVSASHTTGLSIVIAPPGNDRFFLESTGTNKIFDIDHIDWEVLKKSKLLHFGYPPLLEQFYKNHASQLEYLFTACNKHNIVTSLDFSLIDQKSEAGAQDWKYNMSRVLPFTDIFCPSLEELLQIFAPDYWNELHAAYDSEELLEKVPLEKIQEIGKMVIDLGVKVALIKCGHRGMYLLSGNISTSNGRIAHVLNGREWDNVELWCNAFLTEKNKVINASGAGDISIAAFLCAVLDREPPAEAVKLSALAGRNKLYAADIMKDLADWKTMKEQLKMERPAILDLQQADRMAPIQGQ